MTSARLAVAAVAAAGLVALGWWLGSGRVQSAWDRAERDRAELVAADIREQSAAGRRVSAAYQSDRAAQLRRARSIKQEIAHVLDQPAPLCAPGGRAGDIVLPGSLGRLLNGLADDSAPPATAR